MTEAAAGPRLALVASPEEGHITELAETVKDLLDRGWDARLLLDGPEAARRAAAAEPEVAQLDGRVHFLPTHRRAPLARRRRQLAVARALGRGGPPAWRSLRAGGPSSLPLLQGRGVEAALIALRPEIVHFDSSASAVGRVRIRHLLDCKIVVSVGLDDLYERSSLELVLRQADVLHFPSDALRRRWSEANVSEHPRAIVAAPATDVRFFDPARNGGSTVPSASPESSLRVVGVGALSWVYGYEWALQAVRRVVSAGVDCRYRILGTGAYLEALSFARSELGLEDRVELVEPSRTRLKEALAWADVLLDATVIEGPPSAVPEGQAMALPAVVTDRTDVSSAVVDGDTAFTVKRRDPDGLAEKLVMLARDPGRGRSMGDLARRRLLERADLGGGSAAYDQLYRASLRT